MLRATHAHMSFVEFVDFILPPALPAALSAFVQGDSGGLGLGYVDSVPSQDNLQMRRN